MSAWRANIVAMRRFVVWLLPMLPLVQAPAMAEPIAQVHLTYDTYAAGIEVMQMHAFFGLGPWNYQIAIDYHTTGLVGFFYRGQQVNNVRGLWRDERPQPVEFFGEGVWHGQKRETLIDYDHDLPQVKRLLPPQQSERETVPADMQMGTMDTLSALAALMHEVEANRRCDAAVHTYDGRRVLELSAHTGTVEDLAQTSRSIFHGDALRCDFEGREVAGFLIGDDDPEHRRPLLGTAWLASVEPGGPQLPVRIAFQTRWFGWTTMYLTNVANGMGEGAPGDQKRN
jgi:Protein of unknown function (DUF3108)